MEPKVGAVVWGVRKGDKEGLGAEKEGGTDRVGN